jgi:hypothetical protein
MTFKLEIKKCTGHVVLMVKIKKTYTNFVAQVQGVLKRALQL